MRRWPLLLIILLWIGGVALAQWIGRNDRQQAFVMSVMTTALAGLAVLVWLLAFSRLPRRRRLGWAGVLVLLPILGAALVRIRGVDGDLVPIFAWRWSTDATSTPSETKPTGADRELPGRGDYRQFFGPNRDGRVSNPSLVTDWDKTPPTELWRRPVGGGWSGFVVAGNLAITQEQHGAEETVVAYQLATGEILWQHKDQTHYQSGVAGDGPRATPTIDGDRVFTLGSTGLLNCLDLSTGRRIWHHDIVKDNGAVVSQWGVAGSPLVVGEQVIVIAGGDNDRSLVAYARSNGKRLWNGGNDPAQYAPPIAATLLSRPQILAFTKTRITGHNQTNGKPLWHFPWPAKHVHVCLPVPLAPDRVLVSSGYGHGTSLLRLQNGIDNTIKVEELWHSRRMKAKFTNLIVHREHVFGLDDGILACIRLSDGKRAWKRGRYGHGQVLLVGDLLLVSGEHGKLTLLDADPTKHHELTHHRVFDRKSWNPAALAGRYLLWRNDVEAVCLRLPVTE